MMKMLDSKICFYRKLEDNDDTIENKIIGFTATTTTTMKVSASSSLSSLTSRSTNLSSSSSSPLHDEENPVSIHVPISKQTLVLELFDKLNSTFNSQTCEFQMAQQQHQLQQQQYRKKQNMRRQVATQQKSSNHFVIKIVVDDDSVECYFSQAT